jgi:hypothetical protein
MSKKEKIEISKVTVSNKGQRAFQYNEGDKECHLKPRALVKMDRITADNLKRLFADEIQIIEDELKKVESTDSNKK